MEEACDRATFGLENSPEFKLTATSTAELAKKLGEALGKAAMKGDFTEILSPIRGHEMYVWPHPFILV